MWPVLPPYADWAATARTVQLWTQIVGKVRLALSPWLNHGWQVALYVTARGLGTGTIHTDARVFEIDFDFVGHRLVVRRSDGPDLGFDLAGLSVAGFYRRLFAIFDEAGIAVAINPLPNEFAEPIAFPDDETHRSYDAAAVTLWWTALAKIAQVFGLFRSGFLGKASPVHFFWGSFDLAVTRFSGRTAPRHPGGVPGLPDAVTCEAYSHEESSAGFWPGDDVHDAAFYSYGWPAPPGFADADAAVAAPGRWDVGLGEFVLPYAAVAAAADPQAMLLEFLQSTYRAAADLGDWDKTLECALGAPGVPRAV